MKETIGNRIKARRKMLGITQSELAEYSDVSINTLTKIERGEANPTLNVIERIFDTLGLNIEIVIHKQ
ncbi:MAG: helix-turn-helix domain-containing protein [Pseudoflavonifractor sp.]|nr:helix-turn-helix domain-containing protein [Pseudoflavonifractor sp.]